MNIREVLHSADGGPAGTPDHEEIRRRGRRLVAVRFGGVAGVVVVILGLAGAAVAGLGSRGDLAPPVIEQPPPSGEVDGQGVEACRPTDLRPTYLPWVPAGEEIPEPVETQPGTAASPDATLVWKADTKDGAQGSGEPNHVAVTVIYEHDPPDGAEQVEVRGFPAYLMWVGDPGVGVLTVSWREAAEPCRAYAVSLLIRGSPDYLDLPDEDAFADAEGDEIDELMTRYEDTLESAVVRIADSLTHPTEPAGNPQPTDADRAVADAFVTFVLDPSAATATAVPFAAEGVQLGLGDELLRDVPIAEIHRPELWEFERDAFRGYTGTFSALDTLRRHLQDPSREGRSSNEIEITVGEHPHCASPPIPAPSEVRDLRRLSIQPAENSIDSCLMWFTVDLFLADDDSIEAITLDVYEP